MDLMTTWIDVLPFTATGPGAADLPRLIRTDPIEAAGSLMLIEPAHPVSPWAAGVPGAGPVTNLLAAQAMAAMGTSNSADVTPTLIKPAAFSGAAGLLERTSKGGLHGISPQAGAAITQSGPALALPLPMIAHTLTHGRGDAAGHSFYLSIWGRVTRAASGGLGYMAASINGNAQQTNSCLVVAGGSLRPIIGAAAYLGEAGGATMASGPVRYARGASAWYYGPATGTMPVPALPGDGVNAGVTGAYAGGGVFFGCPVQLPAIGTTGATGTAVINAASNAPNKDRCPSWVLYRCYLEDLTISGRTYAEVDAIDHALYTAEVLDPGGRYHADTFTDPATLP